MAFVKTALPFMVLSSALMQAGCTQTATAPVVDHQAQGNLESNNPIGCIDSTMASNTYTPADLYQGVAACVSADDLESGAVLYALAGAYGRFDTLRVTDRSAHQAIPVLQMQALGTLPKERADRFRKTIMTMTEDPARLQALCIEIRRIGSPDYVPRYMVQHGMGAFSANGGSGLDEAFDATAGWEQALSSYLHCPAESTGTNRSAG